MAHDIFISHSSKDKPIADGICANLEAAGLRCWIAPRDIAAGEDWPTAITTAISHSRVMVLIFSASSNASEDVGREIILAANHKLVIIPFMIDNTEPEPGKQYYLARTHWLEAMNPPTKAQIKILVERVKAIVTPVDTNAIIQPAQSPQPVIEKPSILFPLDKPGWIRFAYLWIGMALLLIVLAVSFWLKLQAMTAPPTASPTVPLTETTLPSPSPTLPVLTPTRTPNPTPKANPTPGLGSTNVRYKDGMVMVYVPAGDFIMGSDYGDLDEKPVHTVTLPSFWIDQTEVTNAMYAKCIAAGKCDLPRVNASSTRSNYFSNPEYADFPVINVMWGSAHRYCSWAGARLPTEAEWEKAARGTDGRTYPWGNESPNESLLNYSMNIKDTVAVGSYPSGASPYGALDMAGNVWDYVADYYSDTYYSISPSSNPKGPVTGKYIVIRGGAGNSFESAIRASSRNKFTLGNETDFIGFRCADN